MHACLREPWLRRHWQVLLSTVEIVLVPSNGIFPDPVAGQSDVLERMRRRKLSFRVLVVRSKYKVACRHPNKLHAIYRIDGLVTDGRSR